MPADLPSDLYETDILIWSERQAALLRRVARGEKVNDVDWDHVVDEIEDVGLSHLNTVRSFLRLTLIHLLKIQGWPASSSVAHWRGEIGTFQSSAEQSFAPSMRQRIDLPLLYQKVSKDLSGVNYDGIGPKPWPSTCPVTLDELLTLERAELEARFNASPEA